MRIYDLSMPIHPGMMTWPGDPLVTLEEVASLEAQGARVSRLSLGTHTGTHLDAPRHLLPDGAGVDAWGWEALLGPARVVHLPRVQRITDQHLHDAGIYPPITRVLLRTSNSDRGLLRRPTFVEDYAALDTSAAHHLVAYGVRLVGIDALSVDPSEEDAGPAHRILLRESVAVLEGLDLADVPTGDYWLCCLPLPLAGTDGAPVRAVLVDFEGEPLPGSR